jgi:hypothetical protein
MFGEFLACLRQLCLTQIYINSQPHEFGDMLEPRRATNVEIDRAT